MKVNCDKLKPHTVNTKSMINTTKQRIIANMMTNETHRNDKNFSANPKEWGKGGKTEQRTDGQTENKYSDHTSIPDHVTSVSDVNDLNTPIKRHIERKT